MVKTVRLAKEIQISAENNIGILADLSKLLAENNINIEAVAGYAVNNAAKIMLITDDISKSMEILNQAGYKEVKENPVIILELENKPGALKNAAAILAANKIDIKQIYGTARISGCPSKLILSTSDNDRALIELKK